MTLILPIMFAAIGVGLFARRVTSLHWAGLVAWTMLIVAYHYLKP